MNLHFRQKYIFIGAILSFLLLLPMGCSEEKPPATPQPAPKPAIAKISFPVGQLAGLSINGQSVEEIAALAPDPQLLEAADLARALDIKNEKYLEEALKKVQTQLRTGAPFKTVSAFLGSAPEKYAAQCQEEGEAGLCLIEPVLFDCQEAIEPKNWNPKTYHSLCQSLGRLKALKPEYLVAVFDGDNTLWYQDVSNAGVKKAVDSKRATWDATKADFFNIYPEPSQRITYKKEKTPYDYYKELYKNVGPLWNYEFAALVFRGLPLKDTFSNFQELTQEPYAPIPFPEMTDLIEYLNHQGILTGIVSASPVFGVIPMVESLQAGIPLDRIEGLDVFIKDPSNPVSLPIRLSRLINQGQLDAATGKVSKFQNYQQVLETYGDWIIVDVDHVINARGGKGVQSRSIVRRYVADRNRKAQSSSDKIDIDDMRMVLIGGDNFARPTDIQVLEGDRKAMALEGGNDQGLAESLSFLEKNGNIPGGNDFLFIHRMTLEEPGKIIPKKGKLENFKQFIEQQRLIHPNSVGQVLIQPAVTDVKVLGSKGGFLSKTPEISPETQPSETQPSETQPAETLPNEAQPSETQPLVPAAPPSGTGAAVPESPTAPPPGSTPGAPPEGAKLPPLPPAPPSLDALP